MIKNYLLHFIFILFSIAVIGQQNVYHTNLKTDGCLLGSGLSMVVLDQFVLKHKKGFTPQELAMLNQMDVPKIDRSAIYNLSGTAADISDGLLVGTTFIPIALLASKSVRREWLDVGVIGAEAVLINLGLTTVTKTLFGRNRPYVYNDFLKENERVKPAARRSFFSGHTSHVAAVGFFTASVFSDFYPDSRYKWLVWTGAAILPAATGYSRYLAGRHFPTDVIVGYGIGALIGYLLPKMHKTKKVKGLTVTGGASGVFMNYTF